MKRMRQMNLLKLLRAASWVEAVFKILDIANKIQEYKDLPPYESALAYFSERIGADLGKDPEEVKPIVDRVFRILGLDDLIKKIKF